MMGTSVVYSSGDDGVAGGGGVCLNAQSDSFFYPAYGYVLNWDRTTGAERKGV